MKKLLTISAIALAVMSGSAMAAKDVSFVGTVTDVTCDLNPTVNGATQNLISLGTVAKGATGTGVDFSLKADTASTACANLPGKTSIVFTGPMTAAGLAATSGAATDAIVVLKAKNDTANNVAPITQMDNTRVFDSTKIGTDGAQYTAALKGGAVAGDFHSTVSYMVAYH